MERFIIVLNTDGVGVGKAKIFHQENFDNELEITEEQYNQITEFPLKLTLEDGKVVYWEKTEIVYEPIESIPQTPTPEERITALEEVINFLLGM